MSGGKSTGEGSRISQEDSETPGRVAERRRLSSAGGVCVAVVWLLVASACQHRKLLLELLDAARIKVSHPAAVTHSGHIGNRHDSGKPERCMRLLPQQGRTQ